MERRLTQREKTQRAFRVYRELIDTAEWMKAELRGQLECFDLTFPGFRIMELLYREGPMGMGDVARQRECNRQNLDVVVARLEDRGWVRRGLFRLPPVRIKKSRIPKALRGKRRVGRQIAMIQLTRAGEKFMGNLVPKHAKMVKAFMRALQGREQDSLSQLCAKLREGDVVKFVSEIRHLDVHDPPRASELIRR